MIRLRASLSILLALVLALTVSAAGVARGQVSNSGGIVICTGQGLVTLPSDADGNSGPMVRLCPDCVAATFAAVVIAAPMVAAPASWHVEPQVFLPGAAMPVARVLRPPVRGPPVPV